MGVNDLHALDMRTYLTDDDIPKYLSGQVSRVHEVEVCERCKGIGFNSREELIDYHNRDYSTVHSVCVICNGEGRHIVVKTKIYISTPSGNEKLQRMSYDDFKDIVKPWHSEYMEFNVNIEKKDVDYLKRKYPELAEAHEKYTKLVEHYRMINQLDK